MTKERLMELIAAYGADPMRWPETERADATGFLAANPDALQSAIAEAERLDQLLDAEKKPVSNTEMLAARILNAAEAGMTPIPVAANDHLNVLRKSTWKSVAATFVITTGMGFAAGQSAAAKSARIAEAESLLSLTLDNPYDNTDIWGDLK